jgi:hypothetical protein
MACKGDDPRVFPNRDDIDATSQAAIQEVDESRQRRWGEKDLPRG